MRYTSRCKSRPPYSPGSCFRTCTNAALTLPYSTRAKRNRQVVTALVWLVELEVRNLLKILAVAGQKGQVMLKGCCGNQDVQIPDLLSDLSGKAAPDLGKAFHDWLGKGKNSFAFQEAS
jgi:hypothetical protein